MKENKSIFEHHLLCSTCGFKFTVESEYSDNTKLDLPKKFCPECGQKKIQIDPQFLGVSMKPSAKAQARMNIEASRVALEMAAKQKRQDEEMEINKEITVTSHQKGSEGKQFKVPKKVVESIREKVAPEFKE
jgi:hypothetical protein